MTALQTGITFPHTTLADAAVALAGPEGINEVLRQFAIHNDVQSRARMLAALAKGRDARSAFSLVRAGLQEDERIRGWALVGVLTCFRRAHEGTIDRIVPFLIDQARRDPDPQIAAHLIQVAGLVPTPLSDPQRFQDERSWLRQCLFEPASDPRFELRAMAAGEVLACTAHDPIAYLEDWDALSRRSPRLAAGFSSNPWFISDRIADASRKIWFRTQVRDRLLQCLRECNDSVVLDNAIAGCRQMAIVECVPLLPSVRERTEFENLRETVDRTIRFFADTPPTPPR